jgi:hypothetical protein
MELSLAGLVVTAILLLVGWGAGSALLVALLCSLPFGATAWGTLSALGGSSPLIYTIFAVLLMLRVALRPAASADFAATFASHWVMPLLALLSVYAVASSILFPNIFLGQTSVFVPIKGAIYEVPLSPVSGNITQCAYFVLGAICCFAFAADLHRSKNHAAIIKALFAWCSVNALLGTIDLGGKLVGLTDMLAPIRTASYAYLTESMEHNFWRIVGGFSEASAFASHTIACTAFSFAYWRETGSRAAIVLCAVNFSLLVLSTSTTAYVALVFLSLPLLMSVLCSFANLRISRREIQILLLGLSGLVLVTAVVVITPTVSQPFVDLLNNMVLRKGESSSAQERGYWNSRSLESVIDTFGLGVGLGSSRASSWIIAVISQMGIVGALAFIAILYAVQRAPREARISGIAASSKPAGLIRGARAAAFATIVSGSISGAAADPGIVAFICFAVSLTTAPALITRHRSRPEATTTRQPTSSSQQPASAPTFA